MNISTVTDCECCLFGIVPRFHLVRNRGETLDALLAFFLFNLFLGNNFFQSFSDAEHS